MGSLVNLDLGELILWQFVFGEERNLAALNHERVLGKIDAGLVTFEHVQTEQEIDVFSLYPSPRVSKLA